MEDKFPSISIVGIAERLEKACAYLTGYSSGLGPPPLAGEFELGIGSDVAKSSRIGRG